MEEVVINSHDGNNNINEDRVLRPPAPLIKKRLSEASVKNIEASGSKGVDVVWCDLSYSSSVVVGDWPWSHQCVVNPKLKGLKMKMLMLKLIFVVWRLELPSPNYMC